MSAAAAYLLGRSYLGSERLTPVSRVGSEMGTLRVKGLHRNRLRRIARRPAKPKQLTNFCFPIRRGRPTGPSADCFTPALRAFDRRRVFHPLCARRFVRSL